MKVCNTCSIKKPLQDFYKEGPYYRRRCIECQKKKTNSERALDREKYANKARQWRKNNPETAKTIRYEANRKPNTKYANLRQKAKQRGVLLALNREEYFKIVSSPCFYCSGKLNETGHGLDRVNSSKGYTKDNVVPCCGKCNRIKNSFTKEELLNHLPIFLEGLRRLP